MKMRFMAALSCLLFSILDNQSALASSSPTTEKFLSVADIHFNPFDGCKVSPKPCVLLNKLRAEDYHAWDRIFVHDGPSQFSKIGEDTNYPLFKSALAELETVHKREHVRFGLVLGDFLAHEFRMRYAAYSHDASAAGYQAFVKKTLQFMTYKLHQTLPDIDVFPVVGNNDSYTGDYSSVPHGAFYQETAKTWVDLIRYQKNKNNLLRDFPISGYYAVTLSDAHSKRIILLNTVLFSQHSTGSKVDTAARAELSWLHEQLASALKQKQQVILACHIPMGIDVYKTVKSKLGKIAEFWKPEFNRAFQQELNDFAPIIVEMLPAHIHMDGFQFIFLKHSTDLAVNVTPSISPIFGNNPGFKVFSYHSENLKPYNFETYYLPLATNNAIWQKEYNFNHVYQPTCQQCKLITGMRQLSATNSLVEFYKKYYALGNNAQPITNKNKWLPYYWCGIQEITLRNYKSCMHSPDAS